MDSLSQRRTNF